jgi:hypothetical protein
MQAPAAPQVSQVLVQVSGWPSEDRLALARGIMQSLECEVHQETPYPKPLRGLLGLLAQGDTPPSDDECRAILESERLRKHSR